MKENLVDLIFPSERVEKFYQLFERVEEYNDDLADTINNLKKVIDVFEKINVMYSELVKLLIEKNVITTSDKSELDKRISYYLGDYIGNDGSLTKTVDSARNIVSKADEVNQAVSSLLNKVTCPICGSEMVLRKSKFGQFWGCSKYPKCRGIVNIPGNGRK